MIQEPTLNGTGPATTTIANNKFGQDQIKDLVKLIGDEIDTLRPIDDKPPYLIAQLGAILRDYLRGRGERPEMTFLSNGAVYISRASNLAVEYVSGLSCYYLVFPAPIEGGSTSNVEKAIFAHYISLKKDLSSEWSCTFIAVLRQPITEPAYNPSLRVYGGQLHYCGDFVCGDDRDPSHRLYICGVRVDSKSISNPLVGV